MRDQQDIVENIVVILRKNRDTINAMRPCQVTIHIPPAEDKAAKPCLELGKIKLRNGD